MIRILIVDDSLTSRELLSAIFEDQPEMTVAGVAANGTQAIDFVRKKKPDVVVMDINMPGMDGYEASERILEEVPVPIIICSAAWHSNEVVNAMKAFEAGAVSALAKPQGPGSSSFVETSKKMARMVKAMSKVRVIRRRKKGSIRRKLPAKIALDLSRVNLPAKPEIVAIGCSTGGPLVLKEILGILEKDLGVPVVIVQHIVQGFLSGFVDWLAKELGQPVRIVSHNERLLSGVVYFAPDNHHLAISGGVARLDDRIPPENSLRPSVSYLFRSLAANYANRAVGVILTGMGRDGADGLKLMRDKGACTFAQNKESSVVFGMPGEAVRLGAAQYVMSPVDIAATLNTLLKSNE